MSTSSAPGKKDTVILESYLVKTGPLNKALPLSWRQRWFVFSKHAEGELELAYYIDESKMKKKGVIDLTKFISIKPSVTVGGRDNLFALEIQGRTYIMQAANSSSKNVWLAKLYETLSGERVFHASIPQQTQLQASELLMRAVSKTELLMVDPTSGLTVANIDYNTVRRHGNSGPVMWFEVCPCSADELKVFLWTITAGAGACAQIAKEIKLYIEQRNQKHMVAENMADSQIYTSQSHFTCPVPATTTSGVPAQVRVMVKTKRRPTELSRKGSEHNPSPAVSSPPPQSPRALGPNSRQNSFDSVFMNSPEGQNTLANFRERQFTFSGPDSHSSFDPARSLANFRQNSQEASIGSPSPLVEGRSGSTEVREGSVGELGNRSSSPYPVVGRDSGVESEADLSPTNSRKLQQKDSVSSTGSVASEQSQHSGTSVEGASAMPSDLPDDITRLGGQPPVTPPRSEISLRMFTNASRVAQPASRNVCRPDRNV